jgi:hypothetical protein
MYCRLLNWWFLNTFWLPFRITKWQTLSIFYGNRSWKNYDWSIIQYPHLPGHEINASVEFISASDLDSGVIPSILWSFLHLCSLLIQDNLNRVLSEKVPYPVDQHHLDDPHVKANLLFQVLEAAYLIGGLFSLLVCLPAFLLPPDLNCCCHWLLRYIWPFVLFEILIPIYKIISHISNLFSGKSNHNKTYDFFE